MGTINIMIHGLFFMEHKTVTGLGDVLVITAPDLSDHNFMGGAHDNLVVLNYQTIDWSTPGILKGGTPQPTVDGIPRDVLSTILQFSGIVTKTGGIVGTGKGQIKLPWPNGFFSRRLGSTPIFLNTSQIGNDITSRCGSQTGVVTGFAYSSDWPLPTLPGWGPTLNFHFYFQPPKAHDIDGVNNDLSLAAAIFGSGAKYFDLQMDDSNVLTTPVGTGTFVPGLGVEDEISVDEKLQLVQPTSQKPFLDCLSQGGITIAAPVAGGANFFYNLASPANCPNMFLGD